MKRTQRRKIAPHKADRFTFFERALGRRHRLVRWAVLRNVYWVAWPK